MRTGLSLLRSILGVGLMAFIGTHADATRAWGQGVVRFAAHPVDAEALEDRQLSGQLWSPASPGPHPAIVMLHGCGGLRARDGTLTSRHRDWAERFADLGFVVLHVDSFAPRGLRSICSTHQRSISPQRERARDAYAALAFLQSRIDVRHEAIALLGWSNGGSTTLHAIGADSAARPGDLRHDFAAAIAFYPGCRSLAERRRGWTTNVPLLLLVGDADDWTPLAPCRQLVESATTFGTSISLIAYPGAYHDFDAPDMPIHVLTSVATTRSGRATLGTDPAARADAIERVPAFVAANLPPR